MNVALLGFGTVERSVAKLLRRDTSGDFQLDYIFNRNVERKKVSWLPPRVRWTERIEGVLSSDVDVMIELVGCLEPAARWIELALEAGKSVVTATKNDRGKRAGARGSCPEQRTQDGNGRKVGASFE